MFVIVLVVCVCVCVCFLFLDCTGSLQDEFVIEKKSKYQVSNWILTLC